jgi:hypothetical protein
MENDEGIRMEMPPEMVHTRQTEKVESAAKVSAAPVL